MDSSLREKVRGRAAGRCEYCRMPEAAVPYVVFHVDHIIAKQHVDNALDDPEFLAWACSFCNYNKGPNIASIDPVTRDRVNLFHPREDDWSNHFSLGGEGEIVGATPSGRATVRLLKMNRPRFTRLRWELIRLGQY